jgi:hypothetical protein
MLEKLDAHAAATGTNTTIPTIDECEEMLARSQALVDEENEKGPLKNKNIH